MNAPRKDLSIERELLPGSLEELQELREEIRSTVSAGVAGISPDRAEAVADSVTGWLVGKLRAPDRRGAPTRARYRRVLSALLDRRNDGS